MPSQENSQHRDGSRVRRALEVIGSLVALLDEGHIARQIDEPVDRALEGFPFPEDLAYSHSTFHKVIADFVRYLWEKGLPCARKLSESQARDEAVAILEQAYGGEGFTGYDEAVVLAADASLPGLQAAVGKIAELVKARLRQMYGRWVLVRHLLPIDWSVRCAMAAILMERCRDWLPPALRQMSPAQLADDVLLLLQIDMTSSQQLVQPRPLHFD